MKRIAISFLVSLFLISNSSCQNKTENDQSESVNSIFVLDAHTHHGFPNLNQKSIEKEMEYLRNLGYSAINFVLPVNRSIANNLVSEVEGELKTLKKISIKSKSFHIAGIENLNPEKESVACFFSLEHFRGVFNSNLDNIDSYKELGITYITVINNKYDVLFGTKNNEKELTTFGKKVIDRMNQVDLKIDISHMDETERQLVIKFSKKPVIVSHRNCKFIANTEDNITNETLKLLKENGGMVMVSFNANGVFENKNQQNHEIKKIVDHIDHLNQYLGIDKIGFGTDLQAFGKYVPEKLNTQHTFDLIAQELLHRNYTQEQIEKIFHKNYIEFMN